jgi:ATP-dependent exoDNAse (exonuclease V) beta subunit
LANRYVALLLLQGLGGGPSAPDKIVAMTFTRKGAGEFAERILQRLAAAAGDATARAKLEADLALLVAGDKSRGHAGLAPGVALTVDAATLQSALAEMVDQFDRLVLGTIDSFMARSVQTLAFELGLGGFEILEPAAIQRQRERLLGEVFRAVCPEDLESFFQTLKRATLKSSSTLRQDLDRFVQGCHKLLQALPDARAWGGDAFWNGKAPSPPATPWQRAAGELAPQIATHNFGHAGINKSLAGALSWLAARTPGRAGKLPSWLDQAGQLAELWRHWPEGEWTFDYSKKARTVPAAVLQPLRPILAAWLAAECAALAHKTAAIREIVAGYEQVYDRLARRKGRLTFDDLPLLLADKPEPAVASDALLLLAFRWYQRFDHWLLDEFQDTSRVQWGVLKPWLDEAIQDDSGTKSVFVVGDPKQSIYGWRGGEPRLFEELAGSYPGAFTEQIMAESWRSRPAVLALVNRVCTPDTNPALRDPELFSPTARARWHYDRHIPEATRQLQPGYAAVLLAAKAEAEPEESGDAQAESGGGLADKLAAQARVIKAVLERVRPLEKDLTCAILVRKNDHAQAVAQWLRAHGVPQVMVEGVATLAEQSPVVAAVVDALRWLAVPANTLAAGHVSATPLWAVLQQSLRPAAASDLSAGTIWRHWRQRVAEIGAPQITHEWCVALAATQREPYAQYCLRHVSQSAQQAGAALTLPDWLAVLEQMAVRETAAAGSIHVMTIHKAKGLGFDVVFLPDLDSGGGGADDLLIRRDAQGCPTGCLAYPPKWLQAWEPTLGDSCAAQTADQHLEALCVLYVALTRAKEATFLILSQKKPRQSAPARDWVLSAVTNPDAAAPAAPAQTPWGEGALLWENGAREFGADKLDTRAVSAVTRPPTRLPAPVPRRVRRKPSAAGHEALAPAVTAAVAGGGKEFGTAVHEVFEQIEWWAPGQALQGDPDAVALVTRCLAVPEMRALFTPETGADEALRELPVEFMEKDTWWSGVIDRLVLRRAAGGGLRRAVLIDFKTDQVADAAVLRERYSEQLTIYQRAIATALKLRASQVEVVLLSTHLGVVEPLHRRRACADKPRAGGGLPGTGPGDCVGGTSAGLSFPGWSADEAT